MRDTDSIDGKPVLARRPAGMPGSCQLILDLADVQPGDAMTTAGIRALGDEMLRLEAIKRESRDRYDRAERGINSMIELAKKLNRTADG